MKSLIILLDRTKIIIIMKTILFMLPIYLLSMRFSLIRFGKPFFSSGFKLNDFDKSAQFIDTVLFFIILTIVAYAAEKWILPVLVLIFFRITIPINIFIRYRKKIEKLHQILFGENILFKINEINKLKMYADFMFIPVVFILWAAYLDKIIFFIITILCFVGVGFLYLCLNTFYKEYNKN